LEQNYGQDARRGKGQSRMTNWSIMSDTQKLNTFFLALFNISMLSILEYMFLYFSTLSAILSLLLLKIDM